MNSSIVALIVILATAILTGCDRAPSSIKASGLLDSNRMLGLGVTEGSVGYEVAFGEAKRAGIQFIELAQQWDEIESTPAVYNSPFLKMANEVYPAFDTGIVLSLNPIDTNALRLPAHFKGQPFDDEAVVRAFCDFADFAIAGLPDAQIIAISVGNEVDGYLQTDELQWKQYTSFFRQVRSHIKAKLPDVPVGVKTTYAAITGEQQPFIRELNSTADALMATYYPLDTQFRTRSPSVVQHEIAEMIAFAGDRPLHLLETGFPSGAANGSSEQLQAEFVENVLATWESYANKIQLVNFVWLHDMSDSEVAALAKYYAIEMPAFSEFLGSLGMRTHDGRSKLAFDVLLKHASSE